VSFPLYDVTSVTGYFCVNILNQNTSCLFLKLIMEFNDIEVIIARQKKLETDMLCLSIFCTRAGFANENTNTLYMIPNEA